MSATLSSGRDNLAGMANSGTAGYFGGGFDTVAISGIDKITFSADTKSTISATLSTARFAHAGFANCGVL